MEKRLCNTISVDLGTTYSTACCINSKGNLEVLEDENGCPYIPSVVSYGNPILVGAAAEKKKIAGKPDTIYESKRIMAKDFNDPVVQSLIPYWPFRVVEGKQHRAGYKLTVKGEETVIYPEQVAADIIDYFCRLAEKKTGRPIDQVIVTVPAFFDSNQRLATIQAVEFYQRCKCVLLMDEPSAAAVAFSVENDLENKTLVVFDLGGGTFDVSLMKIKNKQYNVVRLAGDSNLGGSTFNNILYGVVIKRIREGMTNPQREFTMKEEATIHSACEQIKTNLSSITVQEMEVELEDEDVSIKVTRAEFEDMIRDEIKKTIKITKKCIEEAGMNLSQIDYVAMIGGSTSIPLIRSMLESTFPMSKVARSGDVRTAVARGAFVRLIEYMKSEELRRNAEAGGKERFVMPAPARLVHEALQRSGPGYVVVEDNGFVTPDRENGYVVPDRGSGFVVPDRGSGYVIPEEGGVALAQNSRGGFVVPEEGGVALARNSRGGYVIPEEGGVALARNSRGGFVVPEEGGVALARNSRGGFVVPEEGDIALSHPSSHGFVVPDIRGDDGCDAEPVGGWGPEEEHYRSLEEEQYHSPVTRLIDPKERPLNPPALAPVPSVSALSDPVSFPEPAPSFDRIPPFPEAVSFNPAPELPPERVIPIAPEAIPIAPEATPIAPEATPVPEHPVEPVTVREKPSNPPEVTAPNPILIPPLDFDEEGGVVPDGFVPLDVSVVGLDVGIKVKGGKMFVMVPRGEQLPFESKPQHFSCDASHPVDIIVYQGNRPFATDNQRIGSTKTTVDAACGSQKGHFYLRIRVDRNNIVHVDRSYDKKEWTVLRDMEKSLVLSEETIRKLREQAERWKALDEKFMNWIDLRNQFEMVLNQYIERSNKSGYSQEKADEWSKWFKDHRQPPKDGIITEEIMTTWANQLDTIQNDVNQILSV